jgi:hypothetical protein
MVRRTQLDLAALVCYKRSRSTMMIEAAAERSTLFASATWSYRYAWRFS